MKFALSASFAPTGDQPAAIEALSAGIEKGNKTQVLLGVTGSGKTFTLANVIQKTQKPTLVIAHNKTLAAQLYQEFRDFFPENAVSYFVSYYDYYQPEAYIPQTDTYIEKEATINDEIDKLRLATTTNLLTRQDVIVVASVSCIYNLGSPVEYGRYILEMIEGELIDRKSLLLHLSHLQYERSTTDLRRGSYRLRGDSLQIWPAYAENALRIEFSEKKIETLDWIEPISGKKTAETAGESHHPKRVIIYPAKHYMVDPDQQKAALEKIRQDLAQQLHSLENQGKQLEALRLKQKVNYDLEMIEEFGFVNGIENYSRYFDGRNAGEAPYSLLEYFRENTALFGGSGFLTIVDESHMTIPQIRGMHRGDQSRKQTLIDHGFRLPSALDNRPLTFDEFEDKIDQLITVSATPGEWELKQVRSKVVEQLVRPTGLVDPEIEVRPTRHQVEDLIAEIVIRKQKGERCLVTTLTKKMAEALTDYLNDDKKIRKLLAETDKIALPKVAYLHSDVETLDRSDILRDLRQGEYDVVVGINLLREGLDLPEVSLVAILDADKEGFLRSQTALVQTIGRAARHVQGKAILYADTMTGSLQAAIEETARRRQYQLEYNQKHQITPSSIVKPIRQQLIDRQAKDEDLPASSTQFKLLGKEKISLANIDPKALTPAEKRKLKPQVNKAMEKAALNLEFEQAAAYRDLLAKL